MLTTAVINPVNSLIFIADVQGAPAPDWQPDVPILSDERCISVICFPEQDGPTTVVLGHEADTRQKAAPNFSGRLETPSGIVRVTDVPHDPILEMKFGWSAVRVSIWLSHAQWPERITIGVARWAA